MDQTSSQPSLCVACVFMLGKREVLSAAREWTCVAPQNILEQSVDLVTGSPLRMYRHATCYAARESLSACGPAGVWFQLYVRPVYTPPPVTSRGKPTPSAEALLSELENLK